MNIVKESTRFYRRRLGLLPDFIIIGAQRCGTTALYQYLRAHPAIFPAARKEVHFFDNNYYRGKDWYRAQMPSIPHKAFVTWVQRRTFLTGEATPYYLFHPAVPERMASLLPRVRLIVLLRNPVDRAYSHYHYALKKGLKASSFEEALQEEEKTHTKEEEDRIVADARYQSSSHQYLSFLQRGIYADQLAHWFNYFPREQFLILQSEELFAQPESTFAQVLAFLKIPTDEFKVNIEFKPYNTSTYQASMEPERRKQLVEFFTPHNERLYQLLGRSFTWEQAIHA